MAGKLKIRDNIDRVVDLLEQIAKNTGSLDGPDITEEITVEGQGPETRVGIIEPGAVVVQETADMDDANPDGTITLQPGESKAMVSHRASAPFALLAAGAVDKADVEYQLKIDGGAPVAGTTQSPLGLINDPFSFVQKLGGAVGVEKSVVYLARLDESASSSVDLAARLYTEAMG